MTVALGAALAAVATSVSAPAEIEAKKAEAQQVLDEIQQIDARLEHVVDDYNAATGRLDALKAELETAQSRLDVARQANAAAQDTLAERVVALYQNGADESVLEVVLGATSLDDLLDRVDAAKRVSQQDARILEQVRIAKTTLVDQERRIARAVKEQEKVVAERQALKESIESQLATREALYDSIKDQIQDLVAEERERQRRLAEEAQRRLAAQQAAAAEAPAQAGTPDVASSPSEAPAAPPSQYSGVAGIALQYLGVPYVWAGASPGGFDCSGFVMYVFAQVGVSLPHNAAAQYGYGVSVSRDQLQPGDLVFFNGLGHVGIYIGGGQFVHSPHTGDVVKISSIYDSWYAATWVGGRRIL